MTAPKILSVWSHSCEPKQKLLRARKKQTLRLLCGERAWCQWKYWLNQNSNYKQLYDVCDILEYTCVDQWNHVATKDVPTDTGTRATCGKVLQLNSWVKCPPFLTYSLFLFVAKQGVINNIELGVNKAVTLEGIVSLATTVKKLPFRRYSHLISLVLIKSTCILPHTFSEFYRNIDVGLLTLLRLTKPSIICSFCCKEGLLKPKKRIFLTINLLNGTAALLQITVH